MLKENSMILGFPKSGRTFMAKNYILKVENICNIRFEKSLDILFVDLKESFFDINLKMEDFVKYKCIELSRKYCIIKNIDFFSIEKQELFLKYIENTKVCFFFTAYSLNKIQSSALISRLHVKLNKKNTLTLKDLTKEEVSLYSDVILNYDFKSRSQLHIYKSIYSNLCELLKLSRTYDIDRNNFLINIQNISEYPQWFVIDQVFLFLSFAFKKHYLKDAKLSLLLSKTINKYSRINLNTLEVVYLFIDSVYCVACTYFGSSHVE